MAHEHSHQVADYNRAFAIGIVLNLVFVLIEAGYGLAAGSLALIADAGHNLSDVVSLLLAWGATLLARATPTQQRTYGLRKLTIMASLLGAVLLLVTLGGIAWESINRVLLPQPVAGTVVIVVAAIGVVVNTLTALLFYSGQKHDLNIRSAFLHMVADAGVSLGVVLAGFVILWKGWLWIDPVISLLIVLVILAGAWGLFRDSFNLAIDGVPQGVDVAAITAYLTGLEPVERIHDLHIWALSTTEVALTVHLVTAGDPSPTNVFLHRVQQHLHDHFGIEHSTIQIETDGGDFSCMLDRTRCG
jgi:cobalt-zinc-cadmium efflux system protein